MALPHVWLWTTRLAFVLMWTIFHVSSRRKNTRKIADAATVEDRRDGAADVIVVGAGVGGSALAYALTMPISATVNTLANVFSQVLIATTDESREGMRQGCFNYLCSGDFRTTGIMAILGGMNPRPLTLVLHLVAITLTSMGHMLSPFPSPSRFWYSLRIFALALQMLGPHLKDEGVKEMLIPTNAAAYRRTYMATTTV